MKQLNPYPASYYEAHQFPSASFFFRIRCVAFKKSGICQSYASREKNLKNDWLVALLFNNAWVKCYVNTCMYAQVFKVNVCAYFKNEYTRLWQCET